ncbi:MAG TPA: acyl carrier protein [Xanthobacteraceae bacterium]|nr:acyl carrier protein [Xanthobacteraceae bacterium]
MHTTLDRVRAVIADTMGTTPDKIDANAHLIDDIGCDSLDYVEITIGLEKEFAVHIPDRDVEHLHRVSEIVAAIDRLLAERVPA